MTAKKKKLIKIFIIIGIILAVLLVVEHILEKKLDEVVKENYTPELDYEFYEPAEDEERDIRLDKEYMDKDRSLYYTDNMGQRTGYEADIDIFEVYEPDVVFFYYYFKHIEEGNAESLNSLYAEGLGTHKSFTPQRVYGKDVVYLGEKKVNDTVTEITFKVDYMIMKNDGSFRSDIGSDMSRTQFITVTYDSDSALITDVKSQYRR